MIVMSECSEWSEQVYNKAKKLITHFVLNGNPDLGKTR